jgi:HAD superfamily hydrolase (TIGR01549 family)
MQLKKIRHVCFDLDGTLIDSLNTIYNSSVKTLRQLNIKDDIKKEDFRLLMGHHFVDIFNTLKIPVTDIEHFIEIYKKNYFSFINESELYPGTEKTLEFLKEKNISISLLTTKIQEQAEKIIKHFNLQNYFNEIMGRRPNIPVKPNPEQLLEICSSLKVQPEETLIVGDAELDITCGKNAGSLTCGVTYGYREKDKLMQEEADYYINSLSELKTLLTNKNLIID